MIKEFYNEDCMELMKRMKDKSVEMILTDIPYNLDNITNYLKDPYSKEYKRLNMTDVVESGVNQLSFNLIDFVKECLRIAKGTVIIFCAVQQVSDLYKTFETLTRGGGQLRQGIYYKTNAMCLTADLTYMWCIENFVIYKFPKSTFNNHRASPILSYPVESGAVRIHPTEKNHKLLKQLIADNTNKDDVVFDPLMGSGSTCLVALQSGRQTIGCEINKTYYDKAISRIEDEGHYQMNLLEDYD